MEQMSEKTASVLFADEVGRSSTATFDVDFTEGTAELFLTYGGQEHSISLYGETEEVQTANGVSGYIGVYTGDLFSNTNSIFDMDCPVLANVISDGLDMFAAVTIGWAGEEEVPVVLYYGELSEKLGRIGETFSKAGGIDDFKQEEVAISTQATVDATLWQQKTQNMLAGTTTIGKMSVYHANELSSQGTMLSYLKVNVDEEASESYIKNDLGYKSTFVSVVPDTVKGSMCALKTDVVVLPNAYTPAAGTTSFEAKIPAVDVNLGFAVYSMNITLTKVTTDELQFTSSSANDNGVEWELYKKAGWHPGEIGFTTNYPDSRYGAAMKLAFTYQGSTSSSIPTSIESKASIRYAYQLDTDGYVLTYNIWTTPASMKSNVSLVP